MEPGESWAYRARRTDDLVEVRVVRLGTQRPARVLVRFVDDAFEGREDWVPPARLKVVWADVDDFREREARWGRIDRAGLDADDARVDAAEELFELLYPDGQVSVWYQHCGAIRIGDPSALAAQLGLAVEQLTGNPLAFTEDAVLTAPWEVTELVARAAAEQNAAQVLEVVEKEERTARYEAIHGSWSRGRKAEHGFSAEICVQVDTEYRRPRREILRSWCGAEALERFDELIELRKEIRRVGEVAQTAIDLVRQAGLKAEAARLERELGTPVALLRPGRS